jgi:hypothetical protein
MHYPHKKKVNLFSVCRGAFDCSAVVLFNSSDAEYCCLIAMRHFTLWYKFVYVSQGSAASIVVVMLEAVVSFDKSVSSVTNEIAKTVLHLLRQNERHSNSETVRNAWQKILKYVPDIYTPTVRKLFSNIFENVCSESRSVSQNMDYIGYKRTTYKCTQLVLSVWYSKTCLKRNAIVPVFFFRFHMFPFYKGFCFNKTKYKKIWSLRITMKEEF